MDNTASNQFCIATVVTSKAIEGLLEASGEGSYRDEHPWLVARDLVAESEVPVPIMFASTSDAGVFFSHWSVIKEIEVVELHRGTWDSRCSFEPLKPVNPIWEAVDSIFLKASSEQMEREAREGIRVSRQALDEHHIHPYAICETPVFIAEQLSA